MNTNQEVTSWERRGHTRKPNAVVRGIYWVADWLGDFGPLLSTATRGAGHLSVFAGYSLLLIVTLAITILIVVTSAIHSLELLHWIGFSGWTAYPTLFVVEAIFLTGSIQMDLAFKHGKYFPIPPILGFTAGLIFVLASNVMGLADNKGGLIFGIATPFLLIISKAMLAWQYNYRAKIATPSIEEKPPVQMDKIATENKQMNDENLNHIATENIEDSPLEFQKKNTPEMIEENHIVSTNKKVEVNIDLTPELTIEKPVVPVGEINEMEKNSTTAEPAENKDELASEELAKTASKTVTKKKAMKKKKNTPKVADSTIEKVARELEKKHGELPGRKLLAQMAKCTEYRARNILAKMEPAPPEKPKLQVVK